MLVGKIENGKNLYRSVLDEEKEKN